MKASEESRSLKCAIAEGRGLGTRNNTPTRTVGDVNEGLLFKLEQNGINGHLLKVLKDFLYSRKQRVVLNGQNSSWSDVFAGVPQGSIVGPLLFLVYVNDLSDGLHCNPKLFADKTSLFSRLHTNEATNNLNNNFFSPEIFISFFHKPT